MNKCTVVKDFQNISSVVCGKGGELVRHALKFSIFLHVFVNKRIVVKDFQNIFSVVCGEGGELGRRPALIFNFFRES